VHDNQCLWFEQVCGKYLLNQHEYQKSLKEYTYSATHVQNMIDDQYDYYNYSLRKFTLAAFEGLTKVINNELYKYKHVVYVAIGLCKLAVKVDKVKAQELERFMPLYEEY
jgi:hypothetical protein